MSEVGASFGARVPRVAVVWSAFAAASALAVGLLVAVAPRTPTHGERAESARTEAPLGGLAGSTVVERTSYACWPRWRRQPGGVGMACTVRGSGEG